MHVWIENPFDNLPGEGGRAGRYEMMARFFAAAGHSVVVWTSDFSHTRKKERSGEKVEIGERVEYRLVPTKPYRRNVSFARIASHRAYAKSWQEMAEREEQKPDLLIVSAPPLATGDVAIVLSKKFGCKLVVDVQDAWPETFYRLLPRGFKWVGKILFASAHAAARRLYRAADLVTGVTERYREIVGRDDYYVARLGIALPLAANSSTFQLLNSSTSRLVYVGNLGRGYDLLTVLDALACLPDATLDVAGAGEGEEALRVKVRELGLEGRVLFHGYLGAEELRDLLARCDAGIVPMRDDSFVGVPNKVADYAAAGLGIVSSLHGECAALLAKYKCGTTYAWGDAKGLADAVLALPADAGANARKMAEAEFDATKIYPAYVRRVVMV